MEDQDLYLKGIEDLVEAIDYYIGMTGKECCMVFDGHNYRVERVIHEYGPIEFINRIDNYKKEQVKPKLGDVVEIEFTYTERIRAIYIEEQGSDKIVVLANNCGKYKTRALVTEFIKSITKTGEHIDIQGMLDKLA